MQTDQSPKSGSAVQTQQRCHYCRGCGRPLDLSLLGLVHTSIGSAYNPTNEIACANSVDEKRKGSKFGSVNSAVPNAEPDTSSQQPDGATDAPCEASQPTQDRYLPPG